MEVDEYGTATTPPPPESETTADTIKPIDSTTQTHPEPDTQVATAAVTSPPINEPVPSAQASDKDHVTETEPEKATRTKGLVNKLQVSRSTTTPNHQPNLRIQDAVKSAPKPSTQAPVVLTDITTVSNNTW
jgi:hypothetical protein